MTTVSSPKPHLYIHTPEPVFKARVNMPTVTYPVLELTFDGVTLGAYTDVEFDATLLLGTTEGADDLGRVRVRTLTTSTTIPIGRAGRGVEDGLLDVQDNAYITVLDDYRVWAKIPWFDIDPDTGEGNDYKDGVVGPGTFNIDIPPVANIGPGTAGTVDPDTDLLTVTLPKGSIDLSFAMADGATIVSWFWNIKDGSYVAGSATDPVITATFPVGFRWVALSVIDSNGEGHTARCPVLAVDAAGTGLIKQFSVNQRMEKKGQTLDINLFEDAPRDDYPDGTLVMFWLDEPEAPDTRHHMKFIGWIHNENFSISRRKQGLTRSTTLHCVDVAGRLELLPGFSQVVSRVDDESLWSYMPDLNINKFFYYLMYWHSTAINVADFFLAPGGGDYVAVRIDANGSNLFDQVNALANKMVPDHMLVTNSQGQMGIVRDWRLDDVADRPSVVSTITEDEWNDLQVDYNRTPKVHVLRSAAVLATEEMVEIEGYDEPTIPLVFSVAPSDTQAFGQGVAEVTEAEGLALSQIALNRSEGHRFAMLNARYGPFRFSDPTGYNFWEYEPASMKRVQFNIAAERAAQRGLDFTTAKGMVSEISINYNSSKKGLAIKASVSWDKETVGFPATTYIPEGEGTAPVIPIPETIPPPDMGLIEGQDLIAGIGLTSLYRTADFTTVSGSGGPTWTEHALTTEDIISWVVDPFSPGYLTGTGTIDGWVVTATDIYRVTNIFGTVGCTSVHTFAVPLGDSSVPEQEWRTIQASFGTYFTEGNNPWLMVVSHYRDTTGHEGTWSLHSVDGGTTWTTEVQISEHYNSGTRTDARPLAAYLSPKTPGLAYTVAYTITANPPLAKGYVSASWGASWTQESSIDTGIRLGGDYHVPWLASGDSTIYHGKMAGGAVTDEELMPAWYRWPDNAAPKVFIGLSSEVTVSNSVTDSAGGGISEGRERLSLALPATTVRVELGGNWTGQVTIVEGVNSSGSITFNDTIQTTKVTDFDYDHPVHTAYADGVYNSLGSFTATVTLNAFQPDWPWNKDDFDSGSPTPSSGLNWSLYVNANGYSTGHVEALQTLRVFVTEIELADGTIYTPVDDSNRLFSLRRVNPDASIDDLSPASGSVNFGINHYGFAIRSHDNDKTFMLVGATGNDISDDQADDQQGVFVSIDEGATWTEVVAPAVGTEPYSAAFGSVDENIIYIWGPSEYFGFSDDLGATVDSRAGNLSALSATRLVGICGGPLP